MNQTIQLDRHSFHKERRQALLKKLRENHPQVSDGLVLLFANFQQNRVRFRQESSFYYFTGIEEAGAALALDVNGTSTLFIPQCGQRDQWVESTLQPSAQQARQLGVDEIRFLGDTCKTYLFSPLFSESEYRNLLELIKQTLAQKKAIFTLNPSSQFHYVEQQQILERISTWVPALSQSLKDISPLVAELRRKKNKQELEHIFKAVDMTMVAQEGAAQMIENGKKEYEIAAGIEYIFTESGAQTAFPSIVAGGKNGTILHYTKNNSSLKNGDLVVIDIGAEVNYYCADLSRTFPVSGKFTKRQKELYAIVLETQEYIASLAKPGMWLNNKEQAEQSLHHLAVTFLAKKGLDKYFLHGIGHFLGMDVHDVSDYRQALQDGDIITIEPGLYIREENIGIRIEDNYWITGKGAHCLSDQLPKDIKTIEEMVQAKDFDDEA